MNMSDHALATYSDRLLMLFGQWAMQSKVDYKSSSTFSIQCDCNLDFFLLLRPKWKKKEESTGSIAHKNRAEQVHRPLENGNLFTDCHNKLSPVKKSVFRSHATEFIFFSLSLTMSSFDSLKRFSYVSVDITFIPSQRVKE